MCELFAMSAKTPITIEASIATLAGHGGGTGPHRDGWGFAFIDGRDALVVREPAPAATSPWLACLRQRDARVATVIGHIRRATQGDRSLRNTQPFGRELGGHLHLFAHNGMLPGIENQPTFATRRFQRIGETDSEHAFCHLLDRLAPLWESSVPPLERRLDVVAAFARDLRELGPANFIYSDGDAVFAHSHRRRHDDGEIRAPGLHALARFTDAAGDSSSRVTMLASVPLSTDAWEPLPEGEVIALQGGHITLRTAP